MIKINNYSMDYNVGKIVFYKDGKKVEINHNSYFQNVYTLENNVFKQNFMEKLISIDPGQNFKRAIKENLSRKDCYYMTYSEEYCSYKKIALYIYADFQVTEVIDHIWENETAYINAVAVSLHAEYEVTEREELPYDPSFKLPEGARWYSDNIKDKYNNTYKIVDFTDSPQKNIYLKKGGNLKYIAHLTKRIEKREKMLFRVGPYTKIEYSEKRKKVDKMADKFNEILTGLNFSHYQIEKLLEHFDIIEK